MKTMKLLFGVLLAFSTMFLFERCSESGEKGQNDTTKTDTTETEKMTSAERSANDTTGQFAEGCTIENGACNNTERYGTQTDGGGKEIAPSVGRTMVGDFYHKYDGKIIKGGFISKEAIDAIFCNHQDFNGLYCYISQDAEGKERIVIEGWRAVDPSGNTITQVIFDPSIPPADRYKTFQTQTLCPTMCGYCGE